MVQRQTVGNAAVEATSALAALQNARQERDAALDIEIAIPWVEGVTLEAQRRYRLGASGGGRRLPHRGAVPRGEASRRPEPRQHAG